MFAPRKITALLIALGALTALALLAPLDARVNCAPRDRACQALHGLSTPAERARTAELNREAAEAAQSAPDDTAYRDSQRQYRRDMRQYRQDQRRSQNTMRDRRSDARPAMRPDRERDGRRVLLRRRSRPETAEELDRDPCAPTGGQVSPNILAPRTGLNNAVTGLTTFNARTNGNPGACEGPRRR